MEDVHTIGKDVPPEHGHDIEMEILRSEVNQLDEKSINIFLTKLETQMGLASRGDSFVPLTNPFRQFFREDELDTTGLPCNVDLDRVIEQKRRLVNLFSELYHRSTEIGICSNPSQDVSGDEFTVGVRITRLIETAADYFEVVFAWVRIYERINHPNLVPIQGDIDGSIFRVKTLDDSSEDDERTAYQRLLLYLLNELKRQGMKRYKGQCCKQITHGPYLTRAWKPIMEIEEFVYLLTQKEDKYDMWKNLTSKASNVKESISHLTHCKDIQFPEIKKDRHVWSFRNGLFVGKEWDASKNKYTTRFYPYGSTEFDSLDPTIVACKWFDQDFKPYDDIHWSDIPTPFMDSIFKYQKFSDDVSRWIYAFGGRLCFDVNEMDSWQCIPFLKGIARSGKSTLITKIFKRFYDSEDVRTLSNNIEKKFGLWSIHDGLMFISPEVKGDLSLEQAEFQSMVSGEDVSIARKNQKALSMQWNVPGILAGNEVPNWRDNSGSVQRRVVTVNFSKQVADADPHLDEKLDGEIPAILCKCVKAYIEYASKYSDQDIWNVLPKYFKDVQKQIGVVTNTLLHFLESEKIEYGTDKCVPQKLFVHVFNQHCQENNLPKSKFNPDVYAGPFSSREIEVRSDAIQYRGRAYASQPVIYGLDIMQEISNVEF
jgi:NOL1/NOP2/fmu family ribosome biogenesis protein